MKNLDAEMSRYGVTSADIQQAIGCSPKTAYNKLNGKSEFTVGEAITIRNEFFPGMRIGYLFRTAPTD